MHANKLSTPISPISRHGCGLQIYALQETPLTRIVIDSFVLSSENIPLPSSLDTHLDFTVNCSDHLKHTHCTSFFPALDISFASSSVCTTAAAYGLSTLFVLAVAPEELGGVCRVYSARERRRDVEIEGVAIKTLGVCVCDMDVKVEVVKAETLT